VVRWSTQLFQTTLSTDPNWYLNGIVIYPTAVDSYQHGGLYVDHVSTSTAWLFGRNGLTIYRRHFAAKFKQTWHYRQIVRLVSEDTVIL